MIIRELWHFFTKLWYIFKAFALCDKFHRASLIVFAFSDYNFFGLPGLSLLGCMPGTKKIFFKKIARACLFGWVASLSGKISLTWASSLHIPASAQRVPDTRPEPELFVHTRSEPKFFSESSGISGIGYFRKFKLFLWSHVLLVWILASVL